MKYDKMSRRMFLQGSGKISLAVPLMQSLLPTLATTLTPAELLAATNPRLKFIGVHSDLGNIFAAQMPDLFNWDTGSFYSDNAVPYTSADAYGASYQSLQGIVNKRGKLSFAFDEKWNAYLDKINILSNVHSYTQSHLHNGTIVSCSSGIADGKGDYSFGQVNYSVDRLIADKLYGSMSPSLPIIQAGATPGAYMGTSYTAAWNSSFWKENGVNKASAPTKINALYNQLVSLGGSTSGSSSGVNQNKRVVDLVLEDFNQVRGSRHISSEDKNTLESMMDQWNDLSKQFEQSSSNTQETTLSCNYPGLGEMNGGVATHKATMKLVAIALSCGVSNVVDYSIHDLIDSHAHSGDTVHGWHHNKYSHTNGYSIVHATQYRTERVLDFIKILMDTPDVNGGTLFDHTIMTYMSEYSTYEHTRVGYVQLLASGAKDLFDLGQHVNASSAPTNKLFITVMKAMGLSPSDYEKDGNAGFGEYRPPFGNADNRKNPELFWVPGNRMAAKGSVLMSHDDCHKHLTTAAKRAHYHFLKS